MTRIGRALGRLHVAGTVAALTIITIGVIASIGALRVSAQLDRYDTYEQPGVDLGCDDYEFRPGAWNRRGGVGEDGREKQAEALVGCETLLGMTRREVASMLDRRGAGSGGGPRSYEIRSSGYGIGASRRLLIDFDRAGEVRDARLTQPRAGD